MANRKKQVYKPKPMTEGKRNLIQGLLQEYDIQSADDIQEALKDLISSNNKREVNVELIMEIVAEHFHISINDLVSSKRNASISKPRQIVMYLCRQMTQESALNIAKKLGKKDHSTVIHGAKAITEELLTDENLKNTINILIKKIDPN